MSVMQSTRFNPHGTSERTKAESRGLNRDAEDRRIQGLYKDAYKRIRDLIHKDHVHYLYHGQERISQRGLTQAMVREVLHTGVHEESRDQYVQGEWGFTFRKEIDNRDIRVVIIKKEGTFGASVVTAMDVPGDPLRKKNKSSSCFSSSSEKFTPSFISGERFTSSSGRSLKDLDTSSDHSSDSPSGAKHAKKRKDYTSSDFSSSSGRSLEDLDASSDHSSDSPSSAKRAEKPKNYSSYNFSSFSARFTPSFISSERFTPSSGRVLDDLDTSSSHSSDSQSIAKHAKKRKNHSLSDSPSSAKDDSTTYLKARRTKEEYDSSQAQVLDYIEKDKISYSQRAQERMIRLGLTKPMVMDVLRKGVRKLPVDKCQQRQWTFSFREEIDTRDIRVIATAKRSSAHVISSVILNRIDEYRKKLVTSSDKVSYLSSKHPIKPKRKESEEPSFDDLLRTRTAKSSSSSSSSTSLKEREWSTPSSDGLSDSLSYSSSSGRAPENLDTSLDDLFDKIASLSGKPLIYSEQEESET